MASNNPLDKHVLIVSYDFLPCTAIGAAVRSSKFALYLPEFGWRTTVVARLQSESHNAAKTEKVVRISAPKFPFSYQLTAWLWTIKAWFRLKDMIRENEFHLLYISCPPFPLGVLGTALAKKTSLPLVIDFRDPWSLDPYRPRYRVKAMLKGLLCKWLWPYFEEKILATADCFLVTTKSVRDAYKPRVPPCTRGPVLLPNGFDESDFKAVYGSRAGNYHRVQHPYLDLLYCGRFAGVGDRSPAWFFRSLRSLNDEGKSVRLRIIGDASRELKRLIRQTDTEDIISALPMIDHQSAIANMRDCDVLLVYQEATSAELSSVAGKTYEYLRSGKPILAVAPYGDNIELIESFGGYFLICTDHSHEAMMETLRTLHSRWQNQSLPEISFPNSEYMNQYNRRALTSRLAELFNDVLQRRQEMMNRTRA